MKGCWPAVLLCISATVFIYLYGGWVFLSVYTKYVFAGVFTVAFIIVLLRPKKPEKPQQEKPVLNLFFTALFVPLSVLYFTGTTGKPYGTARLALPFKKGNYFVFQGGKGLPTNVFHYALRGAIYAIDLVKLNSSGNRAAHIFSTRLEDYAIFNDTIYSPCSGTVLRAKDDNPDNTPPNRDRGPSNTNQVLLETDSLYVFMGHLKQHCVFVHEGQQVTQGQPLGCAGNSGFSLEPHLHIEAHAKTAMDLPWYKQPPLLIEFDGKHYLLFEEIHAGNGQTTN